MWDNFRMLHLNTLILKINFRECKPRHFSNIWQEFGSSILVDGQIMMNVFDNKSFRVQVVVYFIAVFVTLVATFWSVTQVDLQRNFLILSNVIEEGCVVWTQKVFTDNFFEALCLRLVTLSKIYGIVAVSKWDSLFSCYILVKDLGVRLIGFNVNFFYLLCDFFNGFDQDLEWYELLHVGAVFYGSIISRIIFHVEENNRIVHALVIIIRIKIFRLHQGFVRAVSGVLHSL